MDKRRREDGEGVTLKNNSMNDLREFKRARAGSQLAKEKVITFEDLPVEVSTLILTFATNGDDVTAVVAVFVCHLWKDIVKHCVDKEKPQIIKDSILVTMARRGELNLLKWAKANGCPWSVGSVLCCWGRTFRYFAMKWLREAGCPWNHESTLNAAGGHIWKC